MSIEQLLAYAREPSLHEIVRYWDKARGSQRFPAWHDIDPVELAPHLPILWAWRWDEAQQTFIGRLAGEAILDALGPGFRGARIEDFLTGERGLIVKSRYLRIIREPAAMCNQGDVFALSGRTGVGERVVLPLAEDGEHPDGVFGGTVYRLPGRLRERITSGDLHTVEFFPL